METQRMGLSWIVVNLVETMTLVRSHFILQIIVAYTLTITQDMSPTLFGELAPTSVGELQVTWNFVAK